MIKYETLTQEQMKPFKAYATQNKKGVLFILMRDSENNLHKLVSVSGSGMQHSYTKIKSLTTAHKMWEPTKEDYNLFLKSEWTK